VIEKEDPRGRKYYWIGGNEYQHEDIPGRGERYFTYTVLMFTNSRMPNADSSRP
jgi:broad specificity polyphosphatase/5'/3'-nucleotidase SurE